MEGIDAQKLEQKSGEWFWIHTAQDGGAEVWWNRPAQDWGPGELLLACGAAAVADLRAAVLAELGYTCSAGTLLPKELPDNCLAAAQGSY